MTQPHPQRCETCDHREIVHNYGMGTHRPRCKITKWFLDAYAPTTIEHDFIDKLGCASHSSATEPEDDTREAVAKALLHQRKRLFHKLTTGKCVPNGDCADCILCDNAGGCHAEGSYQVQKEAQAAREEERERVVRKFHDAAENGMRELLDALSDEERSLRSGGK